jgi:uncharacterized NAD-dependent epimerase/dehydratase family protein
MDGWIRPDWESTLVDALDAGLDIISGLHTPLESVPRLANAAMRSGRHLVDLRRPPEELRLATGRKRRGKRLLTVGTDCGVGKKFTALALHRSLRQSGQDATFRATGQTGIVIAGAGIALDAVRADFVAGAAEMLSPDNHPDHWDVIEGQGSLFHPAFAGVTVSLIHGSQPDSLVLCHSAGRQHIDGYPDYPIPSPSEAIARYETIARLTNPNARCVAVSVSTAGLQESERQPYLQRLESELGLPCFDPLDSSPVEMMEALRSTIVS